MRYIGNSPIFGLALLRLSNSLFLAMSYLQESNRPFYDDRTTSELWHRQSERFGMERDRQELRERCGNGCVYSVVPPAEIPGRFESYEEMWWNRAKDLYLDDRFKPKEQGDHR